MAKAPSSIPVKKSTAGKLDGVPLYEVSKLLRHSSIKMTERYAHLAPDHLHQVVANRGFSARFQHTENPLTAVVSKNG